MGVYDRPLTDPRRKFPTKEKRRAVTRQQGTEGPIPRGGVGQGPPVSTPRRDKTSMCGCAVGSSAFKTRRRPKKHSSPEVPRIGHRCYTWGQRKRSGTISWRSRAWRLVGSVTRRLGGPSALRPSGRRLGSGVALELAMIAPRSQAGVGFGLRLGSPVWFGRGRSRTKLSYLSKSKFRTTNSFRTNSQLRRMALSNKFLSPTYAPAHGDIAPYFFLKKIFRSDGEICVSVA